MTRTESIYAEVIRHTIEIGNGWGQGGRPSPLKGFYVLDHAVVGLESGHVNTRMISSAAETFSQGVQASLMAALDGLPPKEFVHDFALNIDMNLPGPVQVRNSYGIIALGPVVAQTESAVVGVYF